MNPVLGALLLWLPAAPFLYVYFQPGFLLRTRMFPRAFFVITFANLAYALLVILLAWYLPELLVWIMLFVSPLVFYVFFWRARPGFGAARKLPPGSLRPAPPGPWRDYLFYLRQAERHGPVFKMYNFVQPMICIEGIRRSNTFLKDHEASTATPPMPFNRFVPKGFMRYMAPAVHLDYRNRMKGIFSDRRLLEQNATKLQEILSHHLLAMAGESAPVNPASELENMTFAALALLFFGVSPDDQEFARLRQLYRDIDYRRSLFAGKAKTEQRLGELERLIFDRTDRRACYLSHFLDLVEDGLSAGVRPARSTDKTLQRNFIYLLQTSYIDVADLLLWILKLLSDNPGWLESVRSKLLSPQPSGREQAGDLAHRIVLETLRLEQSEYLMRRALRDIHFEGFLVPKGWLVRIGIRESHRDGRIFDQPHAFNPDRFLARVHGTRQYSPFGIQQKSCLGRQITCAIAEQFVLTLARGHGWTVVEDGERELGAFHWRPSSRFRIRLAGDPAPVQEIPG